MVSNAYGISSTAVNTISLVYMSVYLLVNFPSNYIIDKYGCRTGVNSMLIINIGYDWYSNDICWNVDQVPH